MEGREWKNRMEEENKWNGKIEWKKRMEEENK